MRTKGERMDNKVENEKINKGPFTKCIHFMRVSMDKKEENEKNCPLKISIAALICHVQGFVWRVLVDKTFSFLHFRP